MGADRTTKVLLQAELGSWLPVLVEAWRENRLINALAPKDPRQKMLNSQLVQSGTVKTLMLKRTGCPTLLLATVMCGQETGQDSTSPPERSIELTRRAICLESKERKTALTCAAVDPHHNGRRRVNHNRINSR